MNYSKRLIHQVVPLHFAPTFFFVGKSLPKSPFSHPKPPSPAIPEVQVNTLICEGIIFLSEKTMALQSPFWLRKFQGFFCSFFFPGINAPFGQAFLKGRSHRSSTVFPEHEQNEGLKKFHQFGVWKVFV